MLLSATVPTAFKRTPPACFVEHFQSCKKPRGSVSAAASWQLLPQQHSCFLRPAQRLPASAGMICASAPASSPATPETRKLISRTEVPAFIQRDDLMDQMYRWALMEASESGIRNFGMPMTIEPNYKNDMIWGYTVGIYKEGAKLTDIGISFDDEVVEKHQWVGRGDDGFPIMEGRVDSVDGKHFEIWKLDTNPVSEDLRATLRAFCTALVAALNRYYAFGSVFVDDARD